MSIEKRDPLEVQYEPTYGEHLVGISINPGGLEQVSHIKRVVADLIDYIEANIKDGRSAGFCIRQLEEAAMSGVKAVTGPKWPY